MNPQPETTTFELTAAQVSFLQRMIKRNIEYNDFANPKAKGKTKDLWNELHLIFTKP